MSTIYVHLDLNYLFLSFLAKKKKQPKTTNQRKKKKGGKKSAWYRIPPYNTYCGSQVSRMLPERLRTDCLWDNFPLYYTDVKSGLRKLEKWCRMEKTSFLCHFFQLLRIQIENLKVFSNNICRPSSAHLILIYTCWVFITIMFKEKGYCCWSYQKCLFRKSYPNLILQ